MSEETIDQSAPEVDVTPETTESEVETNDQPEIESESPADEGDTPVLDEEEVEYEGNKYKVPKELKDALMRQSDYTRKTQEVAEQRKSIEQQQQEFQRNVQVQQQFMQDHAQLYALDSQIQQFSNLNWDEMISNDPVEAMKLDRQYRTLMEMRGQATTRIQQAQHELTLKSQQETAARLEQGKAQLAKEITGWSPEMAKELAAFGKEIGFSAEELGQIIDPRQVKVLHKAHLYDQLMKKAKPAAPKVEAKPVTKISSKTETARKDPDKMSIDEWTKWRNDQLKRK